MPTRPLRLATYNVEWMNALFDDQGRLLIDHEPSARYQTTRADQINALGQVFAALDADGVMMIEAPDTSLHRSTVTALESFARHFKLRARRAITGFPSDTEQEIAFLYDPGRLTVHHDPQSTADTPRFDQKWHFDQTGHAEIPGNGFAHTVTFSKPPLELLVQTQSRRLRLIGVHAKSKAPHGRVSADEFRRISINNRRKQLAECHWLRARAMDHLTAHDSLIVMGDFNDGPGIDKYERIFGQSGVEIVLGLNDPPERQLTDPNALMALYPGLHPTSARFWLAPRQCYFEALLDFIMLSPDLATLGPRWHIWHPFNDPKIVAIPGLSAAIVTASDHFPVTLDLP
ncbi:MAG: endonuclease/exonuclease/phosphatase family protein [Alphaproteobacteria bacterium]|jgi:hypothetical protein